MAGEEDWCDVSCLDDNMGGEIHDWELLPKKTSGRKGEGAGEAGGRGKTRITESDTLTAAVSADDLLLSPDARKFEAMVVSDDSFLDDHDGKHESPSSSKMASSTASTEISSGSFSTGCNGCTGGIDHHLAAAADQHLASAAILASQANNAFIHAMDSIFDPDAAYPGGNPVQIRSPSAANKTSPNLSTVAGSAQKIVGNLLKHVAPENRKARRSEGDGSAAQGGEGKGRKS